MSRGSSERVRALAMPVTAPAMPTGEAVEVGTVTLHGGGAEVMLVPAVYLKVAALVFDNRDWLYEAGVPQGPDLMLPDGHDLFAAPPEFTLVTATDGQTARCVWTGSKTPCRYERVVRIRPDGAVVMDYTLQNLGRARTPYWWRPHLEFVMHPGTRLILPTGASARLMEEHRLSLGGPGTTFAWPTITREQLSADLSRPAEIGRRQYAVRCEVSLPPEPQRIAIEQDGARLEIEVDGRDCATAEVWIDRNGSPGRSRRRMLTPWRFEAGPNWVMRFWPQRGTAEAPMQIEPGATARWTVTWRGGRARGTP